MMTELPNARLSHTSVNALFSTLASGRRRQILQLLAEQGHMTITELAEAIVEEGARTELSNSSNSSDAELDIRQVRLQLYHNHLPRLAEANLLVYDREKETVAIGPSSERFELVRSLVVATE